MALNSGMLTKQSWFSLGGLSVVCETLAIYCIACIYIVNYRYLKLIDASGQSEVVLGTNEDYFIHQGSKVDWCALKSSDVILPHTNVIICN